MRIREYANFNFCNLESFVMPKNWITNFYSMIIELEFPHKRLLEGKFQFKKS